MSEHDEDKRLNRNSIPNLNEAQIKGCCSYVCLVCKKPKTFGSRHDIRCHLIKDHRKNKDDSPLRQFYEVIA